MTKITYETIIKNPAALRDSIIIIIIGCLLIGFGIGISIYDHELTKMFIEANDTGRPINWHGRYYNTIEINASEYVARYASVYYTNTVGWENSSKIAMIDNNLPEVAP